MIIFQWMVVGGSFSTEHSLSVALLIFLSFLLHFHPATTQARREKVSPDKQQFILYWGIVYTLPVYFLAVTSWGL